jgi:Xaa-Pro aminopeptidase
MPSSSQPLPANLVSACSTRQNRLRATLAENRCDALLVSCEKDIQYLTAFVGHDSLLLVTGESGPHGAIIVSDPRYDEFLDLWRKANAATIVMGKRHRLPETVRELCEKRNIRKLAIQAEHITLAGRSKFAAAFG